MEIKDYNPGNEEKIIKLFQESFGKTISERYWRWRFQDNPENKMMIKLMWDNDILAGHYAISPVRLYSSGKEILSALSMTTMTHPDYAGRGIFTSLAEALYADAAEKYELKAVWGFPNNNSHYGLVKNLKWTNLEQIPTFAIYPKQLKEYPSAAINVTEIFSPRHLLAQEEQLKGLHVSVVRSMAYLKWRYVDNPSHHYDIFELKSGSVSYYAVTKVFSSFEKENMFEIDIVDLIFPAHLDTLQELLYAIKKHYSKYDVFKINTWLPLNDAKHILLEKIGFLNILPVTYSGIRILDKNYDNLSHAPSWVYSMSNSDIY